MPTPATTRIRTILVPLDGSPQAEAVLPIAAAIARAEGAALRLLRVAPPPETITSDDRIVAYVDQEAERLRNEGEDYLNAAAARADGVPAAVVVRFGDPREEIVREAWASGADLVAMATHARGVVGRVVLGSVTEAVMREVSCQVLAVRRETLATAIGA